MSYVFTAPQQAAIDVLVNEITALEETTLPAQQADLATRETDWGILLNFVREQPNHNIGRLSTEEDPQTGTDPWTGEQARRVAANAVLSTYSISQMFLPDILCGNPEVISYRMKNDIRPAVFGTIETDITTTQNDITTKKDQLLQYYEDVTGIDPLN